MTSGTGEAVRSAKGLPHKHKDLSSNPQNPPERQTHLIGACLQSCTGRQKQGDPGAHYTARLAKSVSSRCRESVCQKGEGVGS